MFYNMLFFVTLRKIFIMELGQLYWAVGLNTTGMYSSKDQISKIISDIDGEFNGLGESIGNSADGLGEGFEENAKQVIITMNSLKKKAADLESQMGDMDVDSEEFKKLNSELKETRSRLSSVTEESKGMFGKLKAGLGKIGISPASLGFGAVAGAMAKLGKEAYKFSNDFNAAMLEVKTISQSAQDDFSGMGDRIIELSKMPIKDDAVGLSKAMYQIVSAGHDGAAGLQVLEAAAKAATGGVTDTLTAADGLTTVMNAWGMSANDVNKISDQMFTTVKLGKTTFGELGKNIAKVAPLAAASNIEFEQIAAATATITKQGTPTSEAFTQMKAAIVALNKNLGDGWAKTMTLQEGLAKMRDMAGGSDTKLQELTGSSEAMLAVLSTTGEKALMAADDLKNMATSAGATNSALSTMADDAAVKWKQVHNNWNALLKGLGDNIRTASTGLADFLNQLMGAEEIKAGRNFEDTAVKAAILVDQLKDSNTTLEERKNILTELSGIDPKITVDVETKEGELNLKKLAENMDDFNKYQVTQIRLAELNKELAEEQAKVQLVRNKEKLNEINIQKGVNRELLRIDQYDFLKGEKFDEVRNKLKSALTDETKTYRERMDEFFRVRRSIDRAGMDMSMSDFAQIGNGFEEELETIYAKEIKAAEKAKDRILEINKELTELKGTIDVEVEVSDPEVKDTKIKIEAAPIVKRKSIKDLEKELSELEAIQFTFADPKLESAHMDKIAAKEKEIEAEYKKIRLERHGLIGEEEKLETKLTDQVKRTTDAVDAGLAPMKRLTEEDLKQLELLGKEEDQRIANLELIEEAIRLSDSVSAAFAFLGDQIAAVDEDLSNVAYKLADMSKLTGDFADAMNNANSNTFEQAVSLAGIASQIAGLLDSVHESLWDKLFGKADSKTEKILKILTDPGKNLFDKLASWGDIWKVLFNKDSAEEAAGQIEDFKDKVESILPSSTVTDSIVDGLLDGFKLAEDGLGDFAETFGEMMSDAGRNYLKQLFQDKYLMSLMDKFVTLAEDGMTQDEISAFQSDYRDAIEEFKQYTDLWAQVAADVEGAADITSTNEESLAKGFAGLTEQTGDLLEGQFNALRVSNLDIVAQMNIHTTHLSNIAENTATTNEILNRINNSLQNTEQIQTSYVK